jgi:hypothetical protein
MIGLVEEPVSTQFGLCACGQPLPSVGAKRCPQCRAAHARKGIGRQAKGIRKLPRFSTLDRDAHWVAANLAFKKPDFANAPSQSAASLLLSIKRDKSLQRDFWATYFKRRLNRPNSFDEEWYALQT